MSIASATSGVMVGELGTTWSHIGLRTEGRSKQMRWNDSRKRLPFGQLRKRRFVLGVPVFCQATCLLRCALRRARRCSVPAILRSNRAILAKMVWRCIFSNLRRELVPDGFMVFLAVAKNCFCLIFQSVPNGGPL
jgi:hypothetical protein